MLCAKDCGCSRHYGVDPALCHRDRPGEQYVEPYQLLADEVRVNPVRSDLLMTVECVDCLLADCKRYAALYARPADVRKSDGT